MDKKTQVESRQYYPSMWAGPQNGGYSQNGAGRGLRGTFVHGCMLDVWLVACGREKLTLGELLFAPFAWKRVGWYRRSLCSKNLKNQVTERVRARYFYFLRIDDGYQCGTQNNVHCRAPSKGTRTAVVSGKRRLRLRLFSPQKKVSTPSVLAVLVLCLRLLAFVTVLRPPRVYQNPDLANSLLYVCSVQRWEPETLELQLMFSSPSFDYQTWRKGSLPGGWKHTGTLAIVVSPRASKWVRSFRNICVRLRSTITGCRQTQVFGVLSDLSLIILPSESKNQHCDEKGVSSRKDFGWHDAFFAHKKKCLAGCGRLRWLEKLPRRASRKGNPPRLRPFCE